MNKNEIVKLADSLLIVANQINKIASDSDLPVVEELRQSIKELKGQASRVQREILADEVAVRDLPNWARKLLNVISIKDGDILIVRYHEVATVMQLANVLQDRFDVNFTVLAVDNHDKIVLANEVELNKLGWYRDEDYESPFPQMKEGDVIVPPQLAGEIKNVEYKENDESNSEV